MDRRRFLSAAAAAPLVPLTAGLVPAAGIAQPAPALAGRVLVNRRGPVAFHSYVAPGDGAAVNTTIVELADRLLVIDAQLQIRYGQEARAYADSLGKPIEALVLSHEHPDHWTGAVAFKDVPMWAPRATSDYFAGGAGALGKRPGVLVPAISRVLADGDIQLAGTTIQLRNFTESEAADALTLHFPREEMFVGTDLIYNQIHLYLGHFRFDAWHRALGEVAQRTGADTLYAGGHGAPARRELLTVLQAYLGTAREVFASNRDAAAIEARIAAAYPQFAAPNILKLGISRALAKG